MGARARWRDLNSGMKFKTIALDHGTFLNAVK
jgi:hypothetical protein